VLNAGSRLGNYEIISGICQGHSATTYRARRLPDGDEVALKVPHQSSLADPTFVHRFMREGELGSTLNHRAIVQVLEVGRDGRQPFLAMEYVEGTTLAFELAGRQPMAPIRALNFVREVAEALEHAHGNGVVHRNLKPGHIMIVPGGRAKVMDLGVARSYGQVGLTSPDVFLGTPTYSPPEAEDPRQLDLRSDLYSLGIILFEMLQGRPPFEAASPVEVMIQHRERPFPPFEELPVPVPEGVWQLMEQLCRKDPAQRPQDAGEVAEELDRLIEEELLPLASDAD
jgi:serine/threonine-protein kinase